MNQIVTTAFLLLLALPIPVHSQNRQAPQREGRGMMAERFTNFPNHEPKVGTKAPDFVLETLDGQEVRLSDFQGRSNVVLETGAYT